MRRFTLSDAYGDRLSIPLAMNPAFHADTPASEARAWFLREIMAETEPKRLLELRCHASALEPEGVQ